MCFGYWTIFNVLAMKSLKGAGIPGIHIIGVLFACCMVALFVGMVMPEVPKALPLGVAAVFDLCVVYIAVYLVVSNKWREYLNQIIVMGVIAAGITMLLLSMFA